MLKIDAHQHFWMFDPVRDSWIDDTMEVIQRDFLPADLAPELANAGLDGCVLVQSDQSEEHNRFMLDLANEHTIIKGIVGWVDLQSEKVEERLAYYQQYKLIKGFRHVLQGEANRALMLEPGFKRGIALLQQYGFTYDILIFADQLQYATQLARQFPNQKFVLDHIAKPNIKMGEIEGWKQDIIALAECDNVSSKISGMVTEANWQSWTPQHLQPYLDVVVEAFGTDRVMYGSDWPVCLVAAPYQKWFGLVSDYFANFSQDQKDAFFGGNAARFYGLDQEID